MNEEAEADHRQNDKAKRHLQNDALVAEQTFLGDAPAIEEQQRRQKQKKEDIRIQLHPNGGH